MQNTKAEGRVKSEEVNRKSVIAQFQKQQRKMLTSVTQDTTMKSLKADETFPSADRAP